jgi:hypothetical protein
MLLLALLKFQDTCANNEEIKNGFDNIFLSDK